MVKPTKTKEEAYWDKRARQPAYSDFAKEMHQKSGEFEQFTYARYHGIRYNRACIVAKGRGPLIRCIMLEDHFPYKVVKMKRSEIRWFDTISDLKVGIASFKRMFRSMPHTKEAAAFLKRAENYAETETK